MALLLEFGFVELKRYKIALPEGAMINIKAMKTDRRANELLRNASAIKLPRAEVPLRLPLIA